MVLTKWIDIYYTLGCWEAKMQTMFNVHEAKSDFSNILANVEKQMMTVMIMRYGKPIAKLSPIAKRRSVAPMKKYAGKVKIVGTLFDDTSDDWEALR